MWSRLVSRSGPSRRARLGLAVVSSVASGAVVHLLAADSGAFLGNDLLAYLLLAFGAALVAGNLAALLRPPPQTQRKDGDLDRAPVGRSMVMVAIGLVAGIWALVSLIA